MNCPVCNRNNAVSLSICPSCGAMVHDSVREELVPKVTNVARQFGFELKESKMITNKPVQSAKNQQSIKDSGEPMSATTEISAKPTSPTLIEFHNKNAAVPEWRLQLQNVVRQRQERETTETPNKPLPAKNFKTSGATALKAEPIEKAEPVNQKNSTLNSALERIQKSRQQFLEEQKPIETVDAAATKAGKNYPFYIAGKKNDAADSSTELKVAVNSPVKPILAPAFKPDRDKLDTNKLPPLPFAEPEIFESQPVISGEINLPVEQKTESKLELKEISQPSVAATKIVETKETAPEIEEIEEFDDRAPFAMRFNAGLFDLIIGAFTGLILLSPFMLLGGDWMSIPGALAILTTCSIVMFMYLTTSIGLYGKTIGMRLFSIEIVDIESEEYPTFHQAAVSSSVYLLSLAFAGIGFLTLLFNEDRRAVHDIISGTIVVREE